MPDRRRRPRCAHRVCAPLPQLRGVRIVDDLHLSVLDSGSNMIGTVHVVIEDDANRVDLLRLVKRVFHRFGVHSSTVQLETLAQRER